MKKNFTKSVSMAFTAAVFTTSLAAQTPAKVEAQIARAESRSAIMPDHEAESGMELRAGEKMQMEYQIRYNGEGEETGKTVYGYDAAGNRTSGMNYNWENGDWVDVSKFVYEYDAAGNRTSEVNYNLVNGDRVNNYKRITEYNAAGKATLYEYYIWENGSWVAKSKDVYEYDAAGNQTLYEYYLWENGGWVGQLKSVYEYNANGRQTSYKLYMWENNNWVEENASYSLFFHKVSYVIEDEYILLGFPMGINSNWYTSYPLSNPSNAKPETKYDANGNLILIECDEQKIQIKYNSDNNPLSIERFFRGGVSQKTIYEYDEKGNCILFEQLYLNNDIWLPNGPKVVMKYDAEGRRLLFERYSLNWEIQSLVLEEKAERTYDSNGNLIYYRDRSNQYVYKYDDNGNQLSFHYYNIVDNEPVLAYYIIYYYEKEVSNESITSAQSTAYIAGNTLYITTTQSERVAIYSISGAKLYEAPASAGVITINTAAFPQGVLIVKGNGWAVKVVN